MSLPKPPRRERFRPLQAVVGWTRTSENWALFVLSIACAVALLEPEPAFLHLDLRSGTIVQLWPTDQATLERSYLSPTGQFALILSDDGQIFHFPLSEDP